MPFTPLESFFGGLLLHISTSTLLEGTGRIAGISGILSNAVLGDKASWRFTFLGAMSATAFLASKISPAPALSLSNAWISGALVGFGTKLGSGCTSGHFLCGMSRLSIRSIVASCVFTITASITSYFVPYPSSTVTQYHPVYPSIEVTLGMATLTAAAFTLRSYLLAYPSTTTLSLFSGATFAAGLILSGMTNTSKVLGFLRIHDLQAFDPSLLMVLLGGVLPNAYHYFTTVAPLVKQGKTPAVGTWSLPTSTRIDWKLLGGAVLFGVGWGLDGLCPGPAVVRMGFGDGEAFKFVGAFLGASYIAGLM